MQDGIIKGVGNSRFLKSVPAFLTLYPTYEAFAEALIAGTLPVDLNGINEAGWTQLGTALNKANLLSDATAGLLGGDESMTPDGAFVAMKSAIDNLPPSYEVFFYTGTGVNGLGKPTVITFRKLPTAFAILPLGPGTNSAYGCTMLFGRGGETKYWGCGKIPTASNGFGWWDLAASWSGATLSFEKNNPETYGHYQFNVNGAQYMVVALYQES